MPAAGSGSRGRARRPTPAAFARKIETAYLRVLVDVAENLGKLQRAAEMIGKLDPFIFAGAEDANRKAADRGRHAIAVQIERLEIRRADVLDGVHFHAVDHSEEVVHADREFVKAARKPGEPSRAPAGIKRVDPAPPIGKTFDALLTRAAAIG